MSGVSIVLHGDSPLIDEARKNTFCVQCNRNQDAWEVYQDEKTKKWFKKCKKCKSPIPIKDEALCQALTNEKEAQEAGPEKNLADKEKKK